MWYRLLPTCLSYVADHACAEWPCAAAGRHPALRQGPRNKQLAGCSGLTSAWQGSAAQPLSPPQQRWEPLLLETKLLALAAKPHPQASQPLAQPAHNAIEAACMGFCTPSPTQASHVHPASCAQGRQSCRAARALRCHLALDRAANRLLRCEAGNAHLWCCSSRLSRTLHVHRGLCSALCAAQQGVSAQDTRQWHTSAVPC